MAKPTPKPTTNAIPVASRRARFAHVAPAATTPANATTRWRGRAQRPTLRDARTASDMAEYWVRAFNDALARPRELANCRTSPRCWHVYGELSGQAVGNQASGGSGPSTPSAHTSIARTKSAENRRLTTSQSTSRQYYPRRPAWEIDRRLKIQNLASTGFIGFTKAGRTSSETPHTCA